MKKSLLFIGILLITLSCFSQVDKNKEIQTVQKVKVFPNPATRVINILGLLNSSKAEITITNMYGTIVANHIWEVRKNALNIPVANLDKGIYVITIRSKEQNIQTKFYKK